MLNAMLTYTTSMLIAISTFLVSEPMIYILGFIVLAIVFKIFLRILGKC